MKTLPLSSLWRLLKLARPERKSILLAAFFLAISSGTSLLYPQVFRVLIDEALEKKDWSLINQAALALVGLCAVQGISIALKTFLFQTSGDRMVMRLREQLFRTFLHQEISFFDQRRTGDHTSRLSSDATALQAGVINIVTGSQHLVTVLGGLCFLFYTSAPLTLLMLTVVPAVSLLGVWFGRLAHSFSARLQSALAQANAVAEESISGIRTIQSFTAEEAVFAQYSAALLRAFRLGYKRALAGAAFMGSTSFLDYCSIALVLWYGSRLVLEGGMSVGELNSFLFYTLLIAMSVSGLSGLWTELMRTLGSSQHIFDLLDRTPAMPLEGGQRLKEVKGHIEFENVHFAYPLRPEVTILSGLNLQIQAGEVIAFVGPSGTGKSTAAALLARMYDPREGRILLDGHDLRELDLRWLRQQIGMVAQEPILFSCSIAENIRYGHAGATDEEVEAAARAANAHEFISRLPQGYQTQVGERGAQLSGGQKQRVAIARAVLKNPPIMVLDEATSALDAESEYLVQEALERLMKQRTTLVIAHRLSTVASADRVLVLQGGRVVQSGKHSVLLAEDGLYRRLVERQFVAA